MSILQIVDFKKDYGEEPNITHALNCMLYSRNYTFDTKSGF